MSLSLNLKKTGQCPGCGQIGPSEPLYSLEHFSVYDCGQCELRFIDPSLTSEQQIEIYQNSEMLKEINPALENYYEYDVLKPETQTYRDYARALDEAGKLTLGRALCEIGCGAGPFLKFARERGWTVTGLDSSSENIRALQDAGMNAIHADIFKQTHLPRFDVVVLWDVIEHPQRPAELIKKCRSLIKDSGILLIATPCYPNLLSRLAGVFYKLSGGRVQSPLEKMYMLEHTTYFSPKTLKQLLISCGMQTLFGWRTETDLARYVFSPLTRFCLNVAFLAARCLRLQNRLISISRSCE